MPPSRLIADQDRLQHLIVPVEPPEPQGGLLTVVELNRYFLLNNGNVISLYSRHDLPDIHGHPSRTRLRHSFQDLRGQGFRNHVPRKD